MPLKIILKTEAEAMGMLCPVPIHNHSAGDSRVSYCAGSKCHGWLWNLTESKGCCGRIVTNEPITMDEG